MLSPGKFCLSSIACILNKRVQRDFVGVYIDSMRIRIKDLYSQLETSSLISNTSCALTVLFGSQ